MQHVLFSDSFCACWGNTFMDRTITSRTVYSKSANCACCCVYEFASPPTLWYRNCSSSPAPTTLEKWSRGVLGWTVTNWVFSCQLGEACFTLCLPFVTLCKEPAEFLPTVYILVQSFHRPPPFPGCWCVCNDLRLNIAEENVIDKRWTTGGGDANFFPIRNTRSQISHTFFFLINKKLAGRIVVALSKTVLAVRSKNYASHNLHNCNGNPFVKLTNPRAYNISCDISNTRVEMGNWNKPWREYTLKQMYSRFATDVNIHTRSVRVTEKTITPRKRQSFLSSEKSTTAHEPGHFSQVELKIIPRKTGGRDFCIFVKLARATPWYVPCNMHIDACVTARNVTAEHGSLAVRLFRWRVTPNHRWIQQSLRDERSASKLAFINVGGHIIRLEHTHQRRHRRHHFPRWFCTAQTQLREPTRWFVPFDVAIGWRNGSSGAWKSFWLYRRTA